MNKREYKEAMSAIQPSEDVIERIIDMTESKTKRIGVRKSLVGVLVAIMLLIGSCVTVNAATDGAVSDYISKAISVLINGKETSADISTDEKGTKHIKIEGEIPEEGKVVIQGKDEQSGDNFVYEIERSEDGDSIGSDTEAVLEADNFFEPTTAPAE